MYDGTALLNKDKHQTCGIQFADNKFRHNNAIALLFRKPVSYELTK